MSPYGRYFLERVQFDGDGFVLVRPAAPLRVHFTEYIVYTGKLLNMSLVSR